MIEGVDADAAVPPVLIRRAVLPSLRAALVVALR
jgi:hypothetical protein